MAKGPKLEGTRLLRKSIPGVEWEISTEEVWSTNTLQSGWNLVNNGPNDFAVWRGYFDLSGIAIQDLSMMIAAPGWQESDEWYLSLSPGERPLIKTWDLLTKDNIADSALNQNTWVNNSVPCGWSAPGMIDSQYNLEEIFAGRYRTFTQLLQSQIGPQPFVEPIALAESTQAMWGAGDATAANKIHITRIVLLTETQIFPGRLVVPPMSVILPIALIEERDLVYMERLRRSYVDATSRS